MTAQNLKLTQTVNNSSTNDEEYSIPLDISDIINICREYNKLGWQIQNQVESILEAGVEQAIEAGCVKRESLPHIKSFLQSIINNPYFGDATFQAKECLYLIDLFCESNKSDEKILN